MPETAYDVGHIFEDALADREAMPVMQGGEEVRQGLRSSLVREAEHLLSGKKEQHFGFASFHQLADEMWLYFLVPIGIDEEECLLLTQLRDLVPNALHYLIKGQHAGCDLEIGRCQSHLGEVVRHIIDFGGILVVIVKGEAFPRTPCRPAFQQPREDERAALSPIRIHAFPAEQIKAVNDIRINVIPDHWQVFVQIMP